MKKLIRRKTNYLESMVKDLKSFLGLNCFEILALLNPYTIIKSLTNLPVQSDFFSPHCDPRRILNRKWITRRINTILLGTFEVRFPHVVDFN